MVKFYAVQMGSMWLHPAGGAVFELEPACLMPEHAAHVEAGRSGGEVVTFELREVERHTIPGWFELPTVELRG